MTMEKQDTTRRMSRREFLIGAGAALAGAMLACGRGGVGDTGEVPPVSGTAVPVLTPVADATPIQITPVAPPEQAADMAFIGGKVITVDGADTIIQAVAVKDGLIQAVGSDAEIAALAGEATRVIDLHGRAVTPGLIDSHNHFQVVGLLNSYYTPFMPPDVVTIEQLQAALAEAVAAKPEGEWVIGYFLFIQGVMLPTKRELDPVTANHPVWIVQQGGHYGSANSLALQMAGITAETPDPPGGMIGRDPGGEPNGVFYNHRAMDLLRKVVPPYTSDDVRNNIMTSQPLFASCGVTSFHDNNVRGVDSVATYLDVGKQAQMYLRGAVYYTLEWPADLDRALYETEHGYADDFMRFAGFKFLLDGQPTMAYCHEPHNGDRWDMPTWDPQVF
jgi:hypothetical protein